MARSYNKGTLISNNYNSNNAEYMSNLMNNNQGQQGGSNSNPITILNMLKNFQGAGDTSSGAGGITGGVGGEAFSQPVASGGVSAGATGGTTALSGSAGSSSGVTGGAGAIGAGGPWSALAAAIVGQHLWARNKGYHDDKDALLGTALHKDTKNYYGDKFNRVLGAGFGDALELPTLMGAPASWGRGDTWESAGKKLYKAPEKTTKSAFNKATNVLKNIF